MTWCDELKCSNTPSNRKGKNSFKWKTGKNVFGENVWGIFQRIIERVARGTAHNFFYVVLLCARACIKCVLSKGVNQFLFRKHCSFWNTGPNITNWSTAPSYNKAKSNRRFLRTAELAEAGSRWTANPFSSPTATSTGDKDVSFCGSKFPDCF